MVLLISSPLLRPTISGQIFVMTSKRFIELRSKTDNSLSWEPSIRTRKFDRRNQRIVDAIGMTYLSIEEFREVLEGVGFSEFDALEEKKKGWFAVKCRKRKGCSA